MQKSKPYKARKGDICAVAIRHSSTVLHGPSHEHWEWRIGRVASATRDGVIKTAITYARDGFETRYREADRNRWWRALIISLPCHRRMAERLIGRAFPTEAHLRNTIVSQDPAIPGLPAVMADFPDNRRVLK